MQCPNRTHLIAFHRGLATDEEIAHIENCPLCQQQLNELPENSDDFESAVRSAAGEPPSPEDDVYQEETMPLPPNHVPPDSGRPAARDRVGGYELLYSIAKDGMGEVFEGHQLVTGRPVAVKLVYLENHPSERHASLRQRFRRELHIAAGLEHGNIVRVYDAGEDRDWPFLVMERLHGETLKQIVVRGGPLSVADACEVARQVAAGLHYAHIRGVIHRDVKPGNTFVTRDGVVKVLDWGLAKKSDADDLTRTGECWGAVGYAAPEQFINFAAVDRRADIYGLGATLCFAMSGQAPGGTTLLPHDLAPGLAHLIRRMLADNPDDRPSSADEVAQALADFARASDLKALVSESDRLLAALNVHWWDAAASRYRSLDESGALPMATGASLYIDARLNRPAYLYLLWIASDGKLYPLRGWLPASWQPDPAVREADRVRLPEYDPARPPTIPLEGLAGTETIVLLARTSPLTEDIGRHLPAGGLPAMSRMPLDPRRSYEFTCRREESVGGLRRLGEPAAGDDPLPYVQALLRERLGPHFTLIRALSFANRGH